MKKLLAPLVVILFCALVGITARAQNSNGQPTGSALLAASRTTSPSPRSVQNVISSLAILPEADTLIFVNPQRILNDVAPKFMPPKDLEGMRKGFEEVKKNAGIDPQRVEYLVIAVRFKKPTADLRFQPPEFLVVSGGDFSADSLMTLARMASQGKLRDETYGTKTMGLMTIEPLVKEAEKNPFLKAFTEVAIVPLNGNTIAAGTPAYLRAAVDAGEGKDRISPDTLNSLVRDPNALISIAGKPWHSFAKSFGMLGTEGNPRAARCESKIGDFYAALTMDATNFMLRGAMNEDNPDTAKIVSNLVSTFLKGATSSMKDPQAQAILNSIAFTPEGDEVTVRADIPQQMVLEIIKKQMQPKKKEDSTSATPPGKPARPKRRVRRRT